MRCGLSDVGATSVDDIQSRVVSQLVSSGGRGVLVSGGTNADDNFVATGGGGVCTAGRSLMAGDGALVVCPGTPQNVGDWERSVWMLSLSEARSLRTCFSVGLTDLKDGGRRSFVGRFRRCMATSLCVRCRGALVGTVPPALALGVCRWTPPPIFCEKVTPSAMMSATLSVASLHHSFEGGIALARGLSRSRETQFLWSPIFKSTVAGRVAMTV